LIVTFDPVRDKHCRSGRGKVAQDEEERTMPFAVFNKKLLGRGQSTEACDEVVDVSRPNLLGNPFPIGVGPNSSREQVIDRYRVWLAKQIRDGNEPVIRQ
jgi:hypothetical protein